MNTRQFRQTDPLLSVTHVGKSWAWSRTVAVAKAFGSAISLGAWSGVAWLCRHGRVAEWFKAPVLKTGRPVRVS